MDPAELLDLQEAVYDLTELAPIEALPVGPLPLQSLTWFARVLRFFARHSLLLAFFGAAVENTIFLGFLLPGGAIVALSAAGARSAGVSLPVVVLLAGLGMTFGAMIDYLLGRAGIDRLLHHPWTGRWGKRLAHELAQAPPLLARHGWWVMLIAHVLGHGRSALAIAAGASRFSLHRFLRIEFPAAILWSAVYAGGGYFLASEWHTFELAIRRFGWAGTGVLIVAGTGYFYWRRRRDRRLRVALLETSLAGTLGKHDDLLSASPAIEAGYTHPNGTDTPATKSEPIVRTAPQHGAPRKKPTSHHS
jgi:membrane-associated protein